MVRRTSRSREPKGRRFSRRVWITTPTKVLRLMLLLMEYSRDNACSKTGLPQSWLDLI